MLFNNSCNANSFSYLPEKFNHCETFLEHLSASIILLIFPICLLFIYWCNKNWSISNLWWLWEGYLVAWLRTKTLDTSYTFFCFWNFRKEFEGHSLKGILWRKLLIFPMIYTMYCFLSSAHPSCLNYSQELVEQIRADDSWQCIDCKACTICDGTNDPVCYWYHY